MTDCSQYRAYYYSCFNLSLCHIQPTGYQRKTYCTRDIHVTIAIRSCTLIYRAPLVCGIPFTYGYIEFFLCISVEYCPDCCIDHQSATKISSCIVSSVLYCLNFCFIVWFLVVLCTYFYLFCLY